MKNRFAGTALVLVFALLAGCATLATPNYKEEDWWPRPTNYQAVVTQHFEGVLKDAESARYQISTPVRAYGNHGRLEGGGIRWVGYLVHVNINAKNSYGGYTGYKPYIVLLTRDGTVFKALEGTGHPLITELE